MAIEMLCGSMVIICNVYSHFYVSKLCIYLLFNSVSSYTHLKLALILNMSGKKRHFNYLFIL